MHPHSCDEGTVKTCCPNESNVHSNAPPRQEKRHSLAGLVPNGCMCQEANKGQMECAFFRHGIIKKGSWSSITLPHLHWTERIGLIMWGGGGLDCPKVYLLLVTLIVMTLFYRRPVNIAKSSSTVVQCIQFNERVADRSL